MADEGVMSGSKWSRLPVTEPTKGTNSGTLEGGAGRSRFSRPAAAAAAGLALLLVAAIGWMATQQQHPGELTWQCRGPGCVQTDAAEGSFQLPDVPEVTKPIHKSARIERETLSVNIATDFGNLFMPTYHIASEMGTWLNDGNGLLDAADGIRHVFFQHNPAAPVWGPMHWGHVASRDLVHWKRLPIAMRPDSWWDRDGVFSGSAGVSPDGTPFFLYTGVLNYSEWGFYYQLQASAVPVNASDPLLIEWKKQEPIVLDIPPGGTHAQFRDPVTPWPMNKSLARLRMPNAVALLDARLAALNVTNSSDLNPAANADDGKQLWFTIVGTLQDCIGSASLYVSEDMQHWEHVGPLYSQLSQESTDIAQCMAVAEEDVPIGTKGFGGTCDQFGTKCRMWECPDYFLVPFDDASGRTIQAFKYSDQVRHRQTFGADWYVLSDSDDLNMTDVVVSAADDISSPDTSNSTDVLNATNATGSANATNATGSANQTVANPRKLASPSMLGSDAFVSQMGGTPYVARMLDYGAVYASKTMHMRDGSIIWMAWVYEDSEGCTEMCGDGSEFIKKHQRWQGLQSLPRLVTYDPWSTSLIFYPVKELQSLRQQPAVYPDGMRITLPAAPLPGTLGNSTPAIPARLYRKRSSPRPSVTASGSSESAHEVDKEDGAGEGAPVKKNGLTLWPRTTTFGEIVVQKQSTPASLNNTVTVNPQSNPGKDPRVEQQSRALPVPGSPEALNAYCTGDMLPTGFDVYSSELVPEEPSPQGPRRRQLEIRANFALQGLAMQPGQPTTAAPFHAGIILRTGNGTSTRVYLSGTVTYQAPGDGVAQPSNSSGTPQATLAQPVVDSMDIVVDRTCSGGVTRITPNNTNGNVDHSALEAARVRMGMPVGASWQGGPVDLPPGGVSASLEDSGNVHWGQDPWGADTPIPHLPLTLSIWVDSSVIEAYAMGGHARVTTRIYPFDDKVAWGVDVYGGCPLADVVSQVHVYGLGSCWVDAL